MKTLGANDVMYRSDLLVGAARAEPMAVAWHGRAGSGNEHSRAGVSPAKVASR